MDNGVDEDEGLEEAGMQESEVGELAAAHAVAYADYGTGHLIAEDVDNVEKIATVI